MAYQDVVLADSPYIYLPFTSNNVSTNLGSKTGMTATSAGITWGTSPVIGNTAAPIFNATNSHIQYTVGTENLFNSGVWTIEAWVKKGTISTWANIVHREEGTNKIAFRIDSPGSTHSEKITCDIRNAAGTTTIVGPTMDTNWHHVVVTSDGTNVRLYFDGSLFTTVSGARTHTFTNSTWRLGAYGTSAGNENFNGSMDEVALSKTALSAARVSAHYSEGIGGVGAGYTAQPMTATASMPDGVGGGNATTKTASPSYDATFQNGAQSDTISNTVTVMNSTNYYHGVFRFTRSSVAVVPIDVSKATLRFKIENITSNGVIEAFKDVNGAKSGTVVSSVNSTGKTTGISGTWIDLDVTSVVAEAMGIGGSGTAAIGLHPNGFAGSIYSSEYSVSFDVQPRLIVTYVEVSPDATVSTSPAAASVEMPSAVVSLGDGGVATPMAAHSEILEPTFTTEINYQAPSMLAEASMANAVGGTVVAAPTLTASAVMTDATAIPQTNKSVVAGAGTAYASFADNLRVNGQLLGQSEDSYFNRISSFNPPIWLRLNESGGNALYNSGTVNTQTHHGWAVNVGLGREDGPAGRHSAYFDGNAFIRQIEHSSGLDKGTVLEFSIRTTKKNQFLMASAEFENEYRLDLVDGRLQFTNMYWYPQHVGIDDPYFVKTQTFTDIADGEWHTIYLYTEQGVPIGTERRTVYGVYVDGELELNRMSSYNHNVLWSGYFPDYIGGNDEVVFMRMADPTPAEFFVGDMSEIVVYTYNAPYTDRGRGALLDHTYFMGGNAVLAGAATATATMGKNRGRGNRKRAILLSGFSSDFEKGIDAPSLAPSAGDTFTGRSALGENIGKEEYNQYYSPEYYTVGGREDVGDSSGRITYPQYPRMVEGVQTDRVFIHGPNKRSMTGGGDFWYDERTGTPRLVDIFKDIDLDNYDIIMIDGWPNESDEYSLVEQFYGDGALEKLAMQFVDAAAAGKNVLVTHPNMALDMGIAGDLLNPCLSISGHSISAVAPDHIFEGGTAKAAA